MVFRPGADVFYKQATSTTPVKVSAERVPLATVLSLKASAKTWLDEATEMDNLWVRSTAPGCIIWFGSEDDTAIGPYANSTIRISEDSEFSLK